MQSTDHAIALQPCGFEGLANTVEVSILADGQSTDLSARFRDVHRGSPRRQYCHLQTFNQCIQSH